MVVRLMVGGSSILLLLVLSASLSVDALSSISCNENGSGSRQTQCSKKEQNPSRRQIFQSAAISVAPWYIPPFSSATAVASSASFTTSTIATTKAPYLLPEYFQQPITAQEYGRSYFPPLLPPLTQRATYLHKTNHNVPFVAPSRYNNVP